MEEGHGVVVWGDDAERKEQQQRGRAPQQGTLFPQAQTCHPHAQTEVCGLWEDPDFPAEAASINGQRRDKRESEDQPSGSSRALLCRCRKPVVESTVRREGPNVGRAYFHCDGRKCGFFMWKNRSVEASKMEWQRFPDWIVVSDYGFRAGDLRQGGVGDCWFLSALAVVAERPDLILRLFVGGPATQPSGRYALRFFLDGCWQEVTVDDRFPCTEKQRRPDDTGLAFSRAASHQLWVPLLEKGYAKCHGSYRAISGGHIAEALLDLTGAPVETIDFDSAGFDPQEFWQRLVEFRRHRFPMGCATVGNPQLEEVGLHGSHAYSILDVREVRDSRGLLSAGDGPSDKLEYGRSPDPCTLRLLRIRNPHGIGEWTGEWSDRSESWTPEVLAQLTGADDVTDFAHSAGVDDGTFWMSYSHFLAAFQVVDVCKAHQGWHMRSFENAFAPRLDASQLRLCRDAYEIRLVPGATDAAHVFVAALQPTRRGAWCRGDRKVSYRLGDISLVLVQLPDDDPSGGTKLQHQCAPATIVGGILAGMQRDSHTDLRLQVGARYLLFCFCFGHGPYAAEVRDKAPFHVRLYSSQPLQVRPWDTSTRAKLCGEVASAALHNMLLKLPTAPRSGDAQLQRSIRTLAGGVRLLVARGDGSVALLAENTGSEAAKVQITAVAIGMTARTAGGLMANLNTPASKEKKGQETGGAAGGAAGFGACFACGAKGHFARDCPKARNGIRGGGFGRWGPPQEKRYSSVEEVPPQSQRLLMVLVQSAQNWGLPALEVEAKEGAAKVAFVPSVGLFKALPNDAAGWSAAAEALRGQGRPRWAVDDAAMLAADSQEEIQAALAASASILEEEERRQLAEAMESSRCEALPMPWLLPAGVSVPEGVAGGTAARSGGTSGVPFLAEGNLGEDEEEQRQLAEAIALSRCAVLPKDALPTVAAQASGSGGDLEAALEASRNSWQDEEERMLQAALAASTSIWSGQQALNLGAGFAAPLDLDKEAVAVDLTLESSGEEEEEEHGVQGTHGSFGGGCAPAAAKRLCTRISLG